MNKKQKKMLVRIIISLVLVVVFSQLPVEGYLRFGLFMIPYLIIGYDILKKAFKGIRNKQVFDENFLMAVATIGAILLGDYTEGTAVMLFYQIGELFQSYAVGRSRRNISELMDIRPDYANVENNGELEQVDPDEVAIGTIIVVQPGEKVPIDGVITEGTSTLNTSALTGESLPRECKGRRRSDQWLYQYDRFAENPHNKGIWRVHSIQDPGAGREFQLQKIKIRELYFQICKILYSCCMLRCPCPCTAPADRTC